MKLENLSLAKLLPKFMRTDPGALAFCAVLDPVFQQLAGEVKCCLIYSRVDELDEAVVDELAWQMHVDFYDASLSLDKKREVVKRSLEIHLTKGTPYAIERLLEAAFDESWVLEWMDYGGAPGYFKVRTSDRVTDPAVIDKLKEAIDTAKNKRSWLESFEILRENIMDETFAGVVHTRKITTIQEV